MAAMTMSRPSDRFSSEISRFRELRGVKDQESLTTFAELPRFHETKGVKEMIESFQVREVPSYYVKPVSERQPAAAAESTSTVVKALEQEIPCIDLEALSGEELRRAITSACRDWGFFQVVNHGIARPLVERMAAASSEFFAQPLEEKLKCSTPAKVAGPVHFGGGGNRDWRDVLKLNCAPASIVAKDYWPQSPPGFRDTLEEYVAQQQALAVRLLKLISESLDLETNFLVEACGDPKVVVAINHYPPCPDPSLTMGIRAHSDPNTITMLMQDEVGGLQVFKDDEWIDIRPLPNAFVVNVGDQLQILSNGKYSSCLHRVVNNSRQARTSMATFFSPSHASIIAPAPGLVDELNPSIYPKFVYADYIKAFYAQTLAPNNNSKSSFLAGIELHRNYNSYTNKCHLSNISCGKSCSSPSNINSVTTILEDADTTTIMYMKNYNEELEEEEEEEKRGYASQPAATTRALSTPLTNTRDKKSYSAITPPSTRHLTSTMTRTSDRQSYVR
ncbi:hypothetical protein R1sor_003640 [Riccia sorocarpa]|uniref:Fe2OG dioxygenase domain-containing protein n=1 Tax=Riccia sorocarpa TaxID=122646 RepID=A0ABD3H2I7_9MARC